MCIGTVEERSSHVCALEELKSSGTKVLYGWRNKEKHPWR